MLPLISLELQQTLSVFYIISGCNFNLLLPVKMLKMTFTDHI